MNITIFYYTSVGKQGRPFVSVRLKFVWQMFVVGFFDSKSTSELKRNSHFTWCRAAVRPICRALKLKRVHFHVLFVWLMYLVLEKQKLWCCPIPISIFRCARKIMIFTRFILLCSRLTCSWTFSPSWRLIVIQILNHD